MEKRYPDKDISFRSLPKIYPFYQGQRVVGYHTCWTTMDKAFLLHN